MKRQGKVRNVVIRGPTGSAQFWGKRTWSDLERLLTVP